MSVRSIGRQSRSLSFASTFHLVRPLLPVLIGHARRSDCITRAVRSSPTRKAEVREAGPTGRPCIRFIPHTASRADDDYDERRRGPHWQQWAGFHSSGGVPPLPHACLRARRCICDVAEVIYAHTGREGGLPKEQRKQASNKRAPTPSLHFPHPTPKTRHRWPLEVVGAGSRVYGRIRRTLGGLRFWSVRDGVARQRQNIHGVRVERVFGLIAAYSVSLPVVPGRCRSSGVARRFPPECGRPLPRCWVYSFLVGAASDRDPTRD